MFNLYVYCILLISYWSNYLFIIKLNWSFSNVTKIIKVESITSNWNELVFLVRKSRIGSWIIDGFILNLYLDSSLVFPRFYLIRVINSSLNTLIDNQQLTIMSVNWNSLITINDQMKEVLWSKLITLLWLCFQQITILTKLVKVISSMFVML